MSRKNEIIRPTDDEARQLAQHLTSRARFGSLAVLLPEGGHPFASRTAISCDIDRTPVILVSRLSTHTEGLLNDPRTSMLLGEPGKGDPLAHPRITLQCSARQIHRDDRQHDRVRGRFLRRHPKSALYIDFPDFCFFGLEPQSASLNGGFGKAYHLAPDDLLISSPVANGLAKIEDSAIEHMNGDHAEAVSLYATVLAGAKAGKWKISGIDVVGFDLQSGDSCLRLDFDNPLQDEGQLAGEFSALANRAREMLRRN